MFFNYRPRFENSDFLGQLRAERRVANEIGLDLRAKFLKNVETLLQSFHQSGTCDTRDLKPTNGDAIEVIRMKMKSEAQKVLRVLDGRVEDDFSESEFEKPHDEELEDTSARCHVGSDSPKQPGSKKTYRYKCPICNENYTHIANHLKFFHKLKKEDVSKIRLQEKSKRIREAKSGNKRPLRPCPVKSCKWEGYRMDYHLPQKHNIKKGSKRECAPSTSLHVTLIGEQSYFQVGLKRSGFKCRDCDSRHEPTFPHRVSTCADCSLCSVGEKASETGCIKCPAGGFYQDEMGQVECKRCSNGTFVPVLHSPGTRATDCVACPYGTLSNETAKYRACRCLHNFYRSDRFGPCTMCPPNGFVCEKDTAILAPNYFWKWSRQSEKELFKAFVNNIHSSGQDYNKSYSKFDTSLPKPLKCPLAKSCKGGIDSECHQGYQGTLCATCSDDFYFRFHSCLKCPQLTVTVTSSILVISVFVAVFLLVLWGDSKRTENNRTVADVIMSCFKIVISFYQVIAGIFSALAKVHWPITLISMEKFLNVFEGNILQFAPLSCIDSSLRLDQLGKFTLIIALNVLLVGLLFLYLFLKECYIMNKKDLSESQKVTEVKSLKKSCYRNIFLLLLTTYPTTSKSIIQILPLPGACVETCNTYDESDCDFLLRADYSIHCFTPRHNFYWPIASILALYPVGFPLLVFFLTYIYRESQEDEEIAFGLRVFFENYKKKFWFWEVTEMYRKLILISLIFPFGSNSLSQISLTVLTVSVFGVVYTLFRPIKDKFEDRLQTFVLWIIFFDVCLGAVYTNWDESQEEGKSDSMFVNVVFVALNASVLMLAIGKGVTHMKIIKKYVFFVPMRYCSFFRQKVVRLKNEAVTRTGTSDELSHFIEESD